jgi:membrane protease YdiL (CAAX protease family)
MMKTPLRRLTAFLALAILAFVAAGPVVGLLGASGPSAAIGFGAVTSFLLLGATILCARLSRERLRDLGLDVSWRRLRELAMGFGVGTALFTAVALVLGAAAGGAWQLNRAPNLTNALGSLALVLSLLLSEELLFRGYAFQQIRRLSSPTIALIVSSTLFGIYHVVGTDYWAMGAVFRFLMPALGGAVFAYALLRTGSLALPIGLHWGGNWIQGAVLGVGHQPGPNAPFLIMPLQPDQIGALTAPDLLPHLPYLFALAMTALVVRNWVRVDLWENSCSWGQSQLARE